MTLYYNSFKNRAVSWQADKFKKHILQYYIVLNKCLQQINDRNTYLRLAIFTNVITNKKNQNTYASTLLSQLQHYFTTDNYHF